MKGWNPNPKEEKGKALPGVGLSQRQGRGRRSINLIDGVPNLAGKKRGRIRVAFGIELSSGLVGTEFLGFRHHTFSTNLPLWRSLVLANSLRSHSELSISTSFAPDAAAAPSQSPETASSARSLPRRRHKTDRAIAPQPS